jgi:hypothetical protein
LRGRRLLLVLLLLLLLLLLLSLIEGRNTESDGTGLLFVHYMHLHQAPHLFAFESCHGCFSH